MTKAELEKDRDEWKQQAESLQDELDALNEAYGELENINYDLTNNKESAGIKDIAYFKSRLAMDNMLTAELEELIDNYIRWHNE